MDPTEKAGLWIEKGKDPRSAHWQAGIEAVLDIFSPCLIPGKLVPVQPLEQKDIEVFDAILETADLSPNLNAVFLPPPIAGKILAPESAEELQRIKKENPSYKILVQRPGGEGRIMCAEISPESERPGADIFQSGALLGSYNYDTYPECVSGMTQTIRAHMWHKGKWTPDEHRRYTLNWFEKVLALRTAAVRVEHSFSFLHSPSLIKMNPVDAVFELIFHILVERFAIAEDAGDLKSPAPGQGKGDSKNGGMIEMIEGGMLECLNVMRDFGIVKFSDFSPKESEQFKDGFSATLVKIHRRVTEEG